MSVCLWSLLLLLAVSPPAVLPPPSADDPSGVRVWLGAQTPLPSELLEQYVRVLSEDGATCLGFLADADYSRDDLVALGVRKPHAPSILRAIQAYKDATAPPPPPPTLAPSPLDASTSSSSAGGGGSVMLASPLSLSTSGMGGLGISSPGPGTPVLLRPRDKSNTRASPAVADPTTAPPVPPPSATPPPPPPSTTASSSAVVPPPPPSTAASPLPVSSFLSFFTGGATAAPSSSPSPSHPQLTALLDRLTDTPADRRALIEAARLTGADASTVDAAGLVLQALTTASPGGASTPRLRDDNGVVSSGLRALIRLSSGEGRAQVRRRLAEAQPLREAVELLREASGRASKEASEAALALLVHLAVEDGSRGRMGAAGACEAVAGALRAFSWSREVQDVGLKAVNKLSISTPDNKRRFGAAQGCELLVAALTGFPGDRDVQYNALEAIERLSVGCDENQKKLGALGVAPLVAGAFRSLPSDLGVTYRACIAVKCLAVDNADNKKQ